MSIYAKIVENYEIFGPILTRLYLFSWLEDRNNLSSRFFLTLEGGKLVVTNENK